MADIPYCALVMKNEAPMLTDIRKACLHSKYLWEIELSANSEIELTVKMSHSVTIITAAKYVMIKTVVTSVIRVAFPSTVLN